MPTSSEQPSAGGERANTPDAMYRLLGRYTKAHNAYWKSRPREFPEAVRALRVDVLRDCERAGGKALSASEALTLRATLRNDEHARKKWSVSSIIEGRAVAWLRRSKPTKSEVLARGLLLKALGELVGAENFYGSGEPGVAAEHLKAASRLHARARHNLQALEESRHHAADSADKRGRRALKRNRELLKLWHELDLANPEFTKVRIDELCAKEWSARKPKDRVAPSTVKKARLRRSE